MEFNSFDEWYTYTQFYTALLPYAGLKATKDTTDCLKNTCSQVINKLFNHTEFISWELTPGNTPSCSVHFKEPAVLSEIVIQF